MITIDNGYVEYEYKKSHIKQDMFGLYSDNIKSFGWSITSVNHKNKEQVELQLRRNRNTPNRDELIRLELKFESIVTEIKKMKNKEVIPALISASFVGIIGSMFMAISVFFYTLYGLVLSLLISIPGFIGWGSIYFVYTKINNSISTQLDLEIYKDMDRLYETCKRAHKLLNKKDA